MKFRIMIGNIYVYANNKEIYADDAENIKKLYKGIENSLEKISDKVVSYLLRLLLNDLDKIYHQLK